MKILASVSALAALAFAASVIAFVSPVKAVTVREMLGDNRYWPPRCAAGVCILTGSGGLVASWDRHVLRHPGFTFIVRGLCASACERAYRLALKRGEHVIVEFGAQLIYHKPSKAVYK